MSRHGPYRLAGLLAFAASVAALQGCASIAEGVTRGLMAEDQERRFFIPGGGELEFERDEAGKAKSVHFDVFGQKGTARRP